MNPRESTLTGDCVQIQGRKYAVQFTRVAPELHNLSVIVPQRVNSFMIENYGTVTAYFNNRPILAAPAPGLSGEAVSVEGNDGDIFDGTIDITFDAGGTQEVWISWYIYKQ